MKIYIWWLNSLTITIKKTIFLSRFYRLLNIIGVRYSNPTWCIDESILLQLYSYHMIKIFQKIPEVIIQAASGMWLIAFETYQNPLSRSRVKSLSLDITSPCHYYIRLEEKNYILVMKTWYLLIEISIENLFIFCLNSFWDPISLHQPGKIYVVISSNNNSFNLFNSWCLAWRRKSQATPLGLPGKSHGEGTLVG